MKFKANPVVVDAFVIENSVQAEDGSYLLLLDNGKTFVADPGMTARYTPVAGDYLIRQSDGYEYLNPKDVFQKKYTKMK